MIHRGLTSYGPDGALRGELAESWQPIGTQGWEFKLRDARFQNGEKVTSADVKWTIEQIAAERSSAYFRNEMQGVERVETPDDRTVRIILRRPRATLPVMMASYHLPIISRASTRGKFIGAGPFMIKAQERGVSIELEPFTGFHRAGLPKLKRIKAIAYADENLRVAALRSGNVDLIEYVPWQAMEAIGADPALKLDTTDGAFIFLVFNGTRPPFDNPKVRKAVAHAIRREDIVRAAFFGRGSILTQLPIAESSPFCNPQ
jgi:peptide/nickel transport system substrate-binding protein